MDSSKLARPCTVPGHTEVVSAWCQTCQRSVCLQDMLSETHSEHKFISLEHRAAIEKRKEELRKIKETLDGLLSQQLDIETQFNANIEDIDKAVSERSDAFLSEIESWKTKTKLLLQKKAEESRKSMTDRQNQIKAEQNKLKKALDLSCQENYEAYLVMADGLLHAKRQSSVYRPSMLSLGAGSSLKIDAMLLTISDEDSHWLNTPDIEILHHSEFQCNDQKGQVVKLATTKEEGVWMTWIGKRCIKYFDEKGNSAKQILTDFDVYDIDVNSKKELFATVNNGSRIKKKAIISWTSIIKTEPLVTYGIHITSADEILVCLQAMDHGKIGRYSPNGDVIQRIRLDQNLKEIFLRPRQLVEIGSTGDVLVIVDGIIITLDKNGKVKKTWKGELDSDTDKKGAMNSYEPVSLAVTSDGNLFVLDIGNRRIVTFDKLGNVLGVMNDTVMLQNMSSVVFDNKDQIWVACTDGTIHKASLRIHRKTKTD